MNRSWILNTAIWYSHYWYQRGRSCLQI